MFDDVVSSATAVATSCQSHCVSCGVLIFRNEFEAQLAGVAFYPHLNGRFGNKCTGCATGNQFIGLFEEEKIGVDMKEKQGLILAVESGVRPPGERKRKGVSKYDPLVAVVEKAAFGEWVRIKMSNTKTAYAAKSHFRKLELADALDYALETSAISDRDNGTAWLYFKKEVKEAESE